jgi:hypothetical protein
LDFVVVVLGSVVEAVGGDGLAFELVAREEGKKVHEDDRWDDDTLSEEADLDGRHHPEK